MLYQKYNVTMLVFLQSIVKNFGNGIIWVYTKLVPDSVKGKFKDIGVNLTAGSFKGKVLFILKMFAHWYFLMVILSVVVLYRLLVVLQEKDVIDAFGRIVTKAMKSILYISDQCFPLILNLKEMIGCIQLAP